MSQQTPFLFGAGNGQGAQPSNGHIPTHAPQNGQPAPPPNPIPSIDLSLLAGITPEQFAMVARLLQSGAVPMPPPQAQAAPASNTSAKYVPQAFTHQPLTTPSKDVDMDREEGELDEGDEAEDPTQRDFLRPPPKDPRKRVASPHEAYGRTRLDRDSSPTDQPEASKMRKISPPEFGNPGTMTRDVQQAANISQGRPFRLDKSAASRNFVLQLHNAGYTFEQLSNEVTSREALVRLYRSLALPLPTNTDHSEANHSGIASQPLPRANAVAATPTKPLVPDGRKVSLPKKDQVKPAAPNREEYLAKLAALKTSKRASSKAPQQTVAATPTAVSDSKVPFSPRPNTSSTATAATVNSVPPQAVQPIDKKPKGQVNTDLIKKKLAALKAQTAAKQKETATSSDPIDPSSSRQTPAIGRPDIGSGNVTHKHTETSAKGFTPSLTPKQVQDAPQPLITNPQSYTNSSSQSMFSPPLPTPGRPFSALPGLFMAPSPVQPTQIMAPAPPSGPMQNFSKAAPAIGSNDKPNANIQAQASGPAVRVLSYLPKRNSILATGLHDGTAVIPKKQPMFGQSRSSSGDEKMVIEISEEEDDGDEQDVAAQVVAGRAHQQVPDQLSDMSSVANGLARSLPSGGTPGSSVEYQNKVKELAAMQRRLAEAEARAKLRREEIARGSLVSSGHSTPVPQAATYAPATLLPTIKSGLTEKRGSTPSESSGDRTSRQLERDQERKELQDRLKWVEGQTQTTSAKPSTSTDLDVKDTGVVSVTEDENKVDAEPTPSADDDAMSMSEADEGEAADDGKVGSQATTVGTSQPEAASGADSRHANGDVGAGSEAENTIRGVQGVQATTSDHAESINPIEIMDGSFDDDDVDLNDSNVVPPGKDVAIPMYTAGSRDEQARTEPSSSPTYVKDQNDGDEEDDYEPEDLYGVADPTPTTIPGAQSETTVKADELAPELQVPKDKEPSASDDQGSFFKPYYRPYTSPLSIFKDFRYHPSYLDHVAGGFKSLTYSNQIDANKAICPRDVAAGTCSDPSCPYQHFRTMGLTDKKLLEALGTNRMPVYSVEEEKKWKDGLHALINQLKPTSEGKDASKIAARIVEYRRAFIGDPTKTLKFD